MSVGPQNRGQRRLPDPGQIARRRRLLRWTKYALPAGALLLLGSVAAWPELDRSMNAARAGLNAVRQINVQSGHMVGARYRGLDAHNRPFTITADDALQARSQGLPQGAGSGSTSPAASRTGPQPAAGRTADAGDRINLRNPVADTVGDGGSWIRISGDKGVYLQHGQQLDLDCDVTLYRDDGIMLTGPVADIDLARGVVASHQWVHAEGPFGQLDAQGYLLSQRDGIGQFQGPGRLVLNDDKIAQGPAAPAPAVAPVLAPASMPARTSTGTNTGTGKPAAASTTHPDGAAR